MTVMPKSVSWQNGELRLLDQRLLPHREEVLHCENIEQVFEAIQTLMSCLALRRERSID